MFWVELLAGINWAWTLHGNFDWVSNMKMDCCCYFRFCWVAWKEWHSWLDLLWKRLGFDYWVSVSFDPHYTGVSLFFCTRHRSKHSGLLIQNTLWECTFLALHLSHPGGLILLAGSETQPRLLVSPAYSLPLACWKQSSGVILCLRYTEQVLHLASPFPEVLV